MNNKAAKPQRNAANSYLTDLTHLTGLTLRLCCSRLPLCILLLAGFPLSTLAHGDLHLQIEEVTKRIMQEPRNGELYLKRGELHRAHQDWDAAQADYDQASSLNPNLTVVDLGRGKMFLDANWLLSA